MFVVPIEEVLHVRVERVGIPHGQGVVLVVLFSSHEGHL